MQNEITGVQNESCKTLRTMTFNLFHHDQSDDHVERVRILLKENKPDTVGFQEITQTWIDEKLMTDPEIASLYAFVGKDRGDSTHEQTPIFYRKDKFNLIESDTKWLYGEDGSIGSDTVGSLINSVDEILSGRKKLYYRVYTYALLERKLDGKRIAFANTHLELDPTTLKFPNKDDIKNKQIEYVLNYAKAMQAKGYPVVLTGDFNCKMGSVVFDKIFDAGFVCTEKVSKNVIGGEVDALYKDTTHTISKGIDQVFVLAENAEYETYTFLDQKILGEYPADHLPRIATYRIS